jgi:acetamidase/formamidase
MLAENSLRKGKQIHWPRAETPTHFLTMGLHSDLNEAARMAARDVIDFLVSSRDEAYIFCSLAVGSTSNPTSR